MSRRGLLAGAALLVAGCGAQPDDTLSPAGALEAPLRAQEAVAATYDGFRGQPAVQALASRAHARVQTLLGALKRAGGTPPSPPPAPATPNLESALEAERRALQAHVAAIGRTPDAGTRALLMDALAESAQAEAELLHLLGRNPLANPFPGEPG